MSSSPKPPAGTSSPGLPRRPSGPRPAAPLFESAVATPQVPPGLRPSRSHAAPVPRPPAPAPAPAQPLNPRKRRRATAWPFYLAMGLILLALPVGYLILVQQSTPLAIANPDPVPAAAPVELRVARAEGTVQIRRAGGQWGPAKQGEALQPSDGVRTGEASTAVLEGGDQYEVHLEAQTEVAVDELTDSISRVLLGGGMATAKVRGSGKHTFEVHARNSDAVARTHRGTFSISNNNSGTVALGTAEGEVEFVGQGKTVIVRAGQQSVVRPGEAPSAPATIPTSLLLKIDWPAGKTLRQSEVAISGDSEPGAVVTVMGHTVFSDSRGHFLASVKLPEGKSSVDVRARSVAGLREAAERDLRVDTHGPGKAQLELPWQQK